MKIRVTLEVDVLFQPEMLNGHWVSNAVNSDDVGQAVVSVLKTDIVTGSMVEAIKENTNREVSWFGITTPDAECLDYLG
jgi:hypothetical protein